MITLLLWVTIASGDLPAYRQLEGTRWLVEGTPSEHSALIRAHEQTTAADCGRSASGCAQAPRRATFGPVLRVDRAEVPLVLDGSNRSIEGGVHLWHGWGDASRDAQRKAETSGSIAAKVAVTKRPHHRERRRKHALDAAREIMPETVR